MSVAYSESSEDIVMFQSMAAAFRCSKVSEEYFPLLTDLPGSIYSQVQFHRVAVLQD